jgi:ERF superfamily
MSNPQAVEQLPATTAPTGIITPMEMLSRAVSSGADIDILEKLMALQERYEANQARKAFDEAVSLAKSKIPPITRNREGHNKKMYADFAAIARVVDPILAEHSLSYRFRARQDERIHVTCILSHKDGHFEETTLNGPADQTGNKNAIQAIGSTLTYLQRYSLVQALGLAAAEDDDGRAFGQDSTPVSSEQVEQLRSLIVEHGKDITKFCKFMKVERIDDIPAIKFDDAVTAIKFKRPDAKQ